MTVQTAARPASTRIKCGNTKVHGRDTVYHASVADVKACFTGQSFMEDVTATETARVAKVAPKADWSLIPVNSRGKAHYALREADGGRVHFFEVTRPSKGKWAGRTFVKEQASDTLHRVEFSRARGILDTIAQSPKDAAVLYGKELGVCHRCGRTLTDEASRAAGIGPVCASKAGW